MGVKVCVRHGLLCGRSDALKEACGREAGNERDRLDDAPTAFDDVSADDAVDGPISSFDQDVRLNGCDEPERVWLAKNDHVVHAS